MSDNIFRCLFVRYRIRVDMKTLVLHTLGVFLDNSFLSHVPSGNHFGIRGFGSNGNILIIWGCASLIKAA